MSAADVDGWSADLDALHRRIAPRFARAEARERSRRFLAGLLSGIERKNGWQLAEHAGESTPDGMQRLLAEAKWDADAVRDDLRDFVLEHLADPNGILVVDETGFLKKGTKSVGVQRQYSGTAGKVDNCQLAVLLAYASPKGHAFIDRELYLPKSWAEDPVRRAAAGVPENVEFATKPEIAWQMIERALGAGVQPAWVSADEVYGASPELRVALEARRQSFVLGVRSNEPVWIEHELGPERLKAGELGARIAPGDWQRLAVGNGSKGPRVYDWARVALTGPRIAGFGRWLLVRRSLTDPDDLAYYVGFGPVETSLGQLAKVAGSRWAIEECIERAKGEAGLDQYEVRGWRPWYRHITLSLLVHAFLVATRARMAKTGSTKPGRTSGVEKGAMQAA